MDFKTKGIGSGNPLFCRDVSFSQILSSECGANKTVVEAREPSYACFISTHYWMARTFYVS